MGRPKGRKNRKVRAKPRTAYEAYEYWYNEYTKEPKIGQSKKGLFRDKLTESEFKEKYARLKQLDKQEGVKSTNLARRIAMAQERISREGEKKAKQFYGGKLPDLTTEADRMQFFIDYYQKMQGETDLSHDEIEENFKQYYY